MMSAAPIVVELESKALAWPDQARALKVVDTATYTEAGEMLRGIKALRNEIAESCDPVISAAHKAHKVAVEQKKTLEAPLVTAETVLKGAMGRYVESEQRKAREEAARLAAEQRRIDEERRLAEAVDLEAAGEMEAAAKLIEEPVVSLPPPVVRSAVPKLAGVSTRDVWRFEVTDLAALVKAVAEGRASIGLLAANETAIGGMVRSLKGAAAIPGVRVWEETGIAASGRG